jgi:Protein of unknown function
MSHAVAGANGAAMAEMELKTGFDQRRHALFLEYTLGNGFACSMSDQDQWDASDHPSSGRPDGFARRSFRWREGGRRRSWLRRIAVAGLSLVFMAGLAIAALFTILTRGPVEIDFLSERIAQGIEQRIGAGVDVDVGRTVLEKSDSGLSLHVLDVVLKDAKGREILRSPDALVSFNPLLILRNGLSPDKIALRGMAVQAEITADNSLIFKTTAAGAQRAPATNSDTTTTLKDLVAFFLGFGNAGATGGLSALSIEEASLLIEDQRNGKRLSFQNMAVHFDSPAPGSVAARGSLLKDGDTVAFLVTSEESANGYSVKTAFSNVKNPLLQAALGARTPYIVMDTALSGESDFAFDSDGNPLNASATLRSGPGRVNFPSLSENPYSVERASLSATWSAASPRSLLVSAEFIGNGARIALAGPATQIGAPDGIWRWTASGSGWTLTPLTSAESSVVVDNVELAAVFDSANTTLQVENLTIAGPTTALALSGALAKDGDGAAISIDLTAQRMPVRSALRWWPSFVAQPARQYLIRAARDGDLTRFKLTLAMPAAVLNKAINSELMPKEALLIDAAFENATLALTNGLPPISGIAGQGKLDAQGAQGVMARGFIETRPGRRLQLSEGSFALNRIDSPSPDASFRFRGIGGLETVAELLQSPTLKEAQNIDIDPQRVKGQFDGVVQIALPLAEQLSPKDIRAEVNGKMTGVSVDKAIGNDRLENATLAVTTDKTGIEIKGEGRWQGLPVTLTLENDAIDRSLATVLSLTLDEATLRRRGINLGGQLTGPLPTKIRTLREQGGSTKAKVEIDLARATIDGLLPGFQKPPGRAGKLTFDAVEKPNGYSIQNLTLDSGASSFRGQAEAQADGTVTSAKFSLFRLSPGDNVRLDFDRQGNGAKAVIRGNNFDARPFLRNTAQSETGRREPDRELEVDLRTTLLSGHGGEVITGAESRIVTRAGQLRQISLSGKLNGQPLAIAGRATGDGGVPVTFDSDDAGALLRFLDVYSRMSGGDLGGQIVISARRMTGYLIAKDFTLRNEPAIRRLVAESGSDAARPVSADAKFTKMRIDFTRDGSETSIKDAVIFGPQLGVTFNGSIDPIRDRISLSGTYVPAYGLNNAFAQIPVLGNILGGGRNEGLLAVTFGVSGRASQPNVTVNPLSAVAPGIFRKIFEFRNDKSETPAPLFSPPPN